jgi:hypothetical protein
MKNNSKELNWKDLIWEKEKYKNIFLLSLPNQSEDYYRLLKEFGNLFSELIPRINKLKIFTIKPLIQLALFPEDIFLEKTKVPFSWATGCVRSTNGKTSNILCYKYISKKKISSFEESEAETKRGNIHELLHLFFSQQINSKSSQILSLNEGFCEFVPRILLNLQKDIKDSTDFLVSLDKKSIISLKEIDKYGMAHFSSEKINGNVAYASSFLGIMWLTKKLSKNKNYLSGTRNLIKLLSKYPSRKKIYSIIKTKVGLDFFNSKLPMLESIKEIKEL